MLEIKDLLVDDGLGRASFTSKYPRPSPTGLMQTYCRRATSEGATQTGWMISATTQEDSTSVDVDAIGERLLPGVSRAATCVVPDYRYVATAIAARSPREMRKAVVRSRGLRQGLAHRSTSAHLAGTVAREIHLDVYGRNLALHPLSATTHATMR